jgi:hypothetical protein
MYAFVNQAHAFMYPLQSVCCSQDASTHLLKHFEGSGAIALALRVAISGEEE